MNYNVYVDDVQEGPNPIVTIGVDYSIEPILYIKARVFLSNKLVKQIDACDGWIEYHKEWSRDIKQLLNDEKPFNREDIMQLVVLYLNNY